MAATHVLRKNLGLRTTTNFYPWYQVTPSTSGNYNYTLLVSSKQEGTREKCEKNHDILPRQGKQKEENHQLSSNLHIFYNV